MTGFNAVVDQRVAEAYDEAASGGNGKFPPLPKGKYQAQIVALNEKEQKAFEVVPWNPNKSEYAGKQALRIRVKILANSPTGANRSYFIRVPLFSRFAPSQKNPQGAPARTYFDFWQKVVGVTKEEVLSGKLPGWERVAGKFLTITVSEPKPATSDYDLKNNPLGTNEVDFVDAPGNIANTPVRIPGQPVAPWLDANDDLLQGVQAGGAVAAQQQPAAPANAWGVTPAQAQAAVPQPQQAWGAPAAPTAPAVPAGAWGQPPAADPALAAAAASAGPI
jgi:hypothetical protein